MRLSHEPRQERLRIFLVLSQPHMAFFYNILHQMVQSFEYTQRNAIPFS